MWRIRPFSPCSLLENFVYLNRPFQNLLLQLIGLNKDRACLLWCIIAVIPFEQLLWWLIWLIHDSDLLVRLWVFALGTYCFWKCIKILIEWLYLNWLKHVYVKVAFDIKIAINLVTLLEGSDRLLEHFLMINTRLFAILLMEIAGEHKAIKLLWDVLVVLSLCLDSIVECVWHLLWWFVLVWIMN